MNIVKRSTEIKKPNTPVESSNSHIKKWRASSIAQEVKEPAKMIIDERISIAIETPSTPTARFMLSGANQVHEPGTIIAGRASGALGKIIA